MSSEVNISDPAIAAELDKLNQLDNGIPFRASREHAHHTWARTFHSSPELYIQPETLEEVEKAIKLARTCRRRITTVGCGHSPSNMTCTSSWMLNLDKFNRILSVDKTSNLVTMQAGIRLYQLAEELDKCGLAMPNLGSINEQSIAGAISTGTHGSTLRHSILSSSITSLRITLSDARTVLCSPDENEGLFRAALCSLGALGVVTEITFQAVPAFSLHWSQTIYPDSHVVTNWNKELWTQAEFVRVWWFPYTRRATVWHANKTDQPPEALPYKPNYNDTSIGYYIYHNLLYISHYIPSILPWVEWFVFGMQFGFGTGPKTTVKAIQPSRQALLMNCLYSQYVNEWAIPLEKGPEALTRLSAWLNRLKPGDAGYVEHGIPVSADDLWVHAPVEVRVTDTTIPLKYADGTPRKSVRPYLDSTAKDGPTLYLNATLYRPYNKDPPCRERYYEGFEYLMKELGGKPHWAKNFLVTAEELQQMYGDNLKAWRNIRNGVDPEGLFVGPWHREFILGDSQPMLLLEEVETARKSLPTGGLEVFGTLSKSTDTHDEQTAEVTTASNDSEPEFQPLLADASADVYHGIDATPVEVTATDKDETVSMPTEGSEDPKSIDDTAEPAQSEANSPKVVVNQEPTPVPNAPVESSEAMPPSEDKLVDNDITPIPDSNDEDEQAKLQAEEDLHLARIKAAIVLEQEQQRLGQEKAERERLEAEQEAQRLRVARETEERLAREAALKRQQEEAELIAREQKQAEERRQQEEVDRIAREKEAEDKKRRELEEKKRLESDRIAREKKEVEDKRIALKKQEEEQKRVAALNKKKEAEQKRKAADKKVTSPVKTRVVDETSDKTYSQVVAPNSAASPASTRRQSSGSSSILPQFRPNGTKAGKATGQRQAKPLIFEKSSLESTSHLQIKRDTEPNSSAPPSKRVKVDNENQKPEPEIIATSEDKNWKPQYRPNSLDELLEQQTKSRKEKDRKATAAKEEKGEKKQNGGSDSWQPQFRANN